MTRKPVLEATDVVKELGKGAGKVMALKGVSLSLVPGELTLMMGPSGSGKTTLLSILGCILSPTSGSIVIDGIDIANLGPEQLAEVRRKNLGYIFQSYNLFPTLTALENVMLGLTKVRRIAKPEARQIAERWLARVGLGQKLDSLPAQLSGGQQQRVGIARAVAMEPKVLLLDEITSALDPELVGEVLAVVQQLAEDGMTMIVVTHEMSFAHEISHRVVFMDGGRIGAVGSAAEIFERPRSERLATFLARFGQARTGRASTHP